MSKYNWETTKGKVIEFTPGDWPSVKIQEDVLMIGAGTAKEDTVNEWPVGEEVEYNKATNDKGYLMVRKKKAYSGGGGRKPDIQKHKYPGFSISYAKDLVCAGKIEVKDLSNYSDRILQWLIKNDQQ